MRPGEDRLSRRLRRPRAQRQPRTTGSWPKPCALSRLPGPGVFPIRLVGPQLVAGQMAASGLPQHVPLKVAPRQLPGDVSPWIRVCLEGREFGSGEVVAVTHAVVA